MKRFISRTRKGLAHLRGHGTQSPSRSLAEPVPGIASSHYEELAISNLPAELLVHIFSYCEPEVKYRLRLTHTCRDWNLIVAGTPTLWTNVEIGIGPSADDRTFYKFTSLLTIQLDRVAGLPLDVFWHIPLDGPFNVDIVEFLRLKVPFAEWQTLIIRIEGIQPSDECLASNDAFPQLESLTVQGYPTNHIIARIITTSSSLRKLDIQATNLDRVNLAQLQAVAMRLYSSRVLSVTEILYGDALERTSYLFLPPASRNLPSDVDLALPSNVTHLHAPFRDRHLFPHIISYRLSICTFKPSHVVDLGRLITLTIDFSLQIASGCHVLLPSLRHLEFRDISLGNSARIETPLLESLRMRMESDGSTCKEHTRDMESMVRHPGYLLSPIKSLQLDLCLSAASIVHCLDRSPSLESITLSFRDESVAWQTMDNIFGASSSIDGRWALPDPSAADICPQLRNLRLRFHSDFASPEVWRLRAAFEVEQRRESGKSLSIYGSWGREEAYMPLA